MASQVDVYNMALNFLDVSEVVRSVNDNSPVAGACNRWYDWARKKVLESAWWDFATKTPALGLLLDQSTVLQTAVVYPGWQYVYARPVDCFRFLAVTNYRGLRNNQYRAFWRSPDSPIGWGPYRAPFQEALDQIATLPGQSLNILTDQPTAYGVYVTDVQNVGLWTSSFQEAVAWQLAVPIAGPVSANQNAKKLAVEMSQRSITTALAVGLNERQNDPYPESPAISCRL